MAFEHPTSAGVVRLVRAGKAWTVRFIGKRRGRWPSADAAAEAGLWQWDKRREPVSPDIIDWRPLGESI